MFSLHLQFMNQTRQGMAMKMDNMGGTPGMRPGMQPGMGGQVADKNTSHHHSLFHTSTNNLSGLPSISTFFLIPHQEAAL